MLLSNCILREVASIMAPSEAFGFYTISMFRSFRNSSFTSKPLPVLAYLQLPEASPISNIGVRIEARTVAPPLPIAISLEALTRNQHAL